MDQESLAQIRDIVTEAAGATETRLRLEIRQIVTEATETVEGRLGRRFDNLQQQTESLEGRLREEIQQTEGRLRSELDDVKRHAGVLAEHLEHKIELLAEGHESLHQRIENVRAGLQSDIRQESQDTRALLRSTYHEPHTIFSPQS